MNDIEANQALPTAVLSDHEAYGRLIEGLHITGYTFERACANLETLLEGDRWRLSGRFSDPNDFLDSLRLDQFRPLAESRKRIALRIRELQPGATNSAIARTLGVHERTIRRDISANAEPDPENVKPINDAATPSSANAEPRELTGAEAAKRVIRFEEAPAKRAERRAERLSRIVDKNPPLPTGRRWPVIYADPPWRWETWSRETGLDRAPEAHYDTMTVEELMALDVPSIAADACVLFLWATAPVLPQALEVVAAWGFAYKTNLAWVKDRAGTGYWLRGRHEHLLIATRGAIPAPLPGQQGDSVIEAPVGAHSEKPAEVAELIERWYPDVPKIELFRRGAPRPGWAAWGDEVKAEASAAAE